jgi:Protein of unknown function (DUF2510)
VSLSVLLSPAPGWYPDPAGVAAYRWWDGDGWTEGTHAGQAAEPALVPTVTTEHVAPREEPATVQAAPIQQATPVHAATPVLEPAAFEPAAFEPAAFEPAAFEPAAFETAAFETTAFETTAFAPAAFETAAFAPIPLFADPEPAVGVPATAAGPAPAAFPSAPVQQPTVQQMPVQQPTVQQLPVQQMPSPAPPSSGPAPAARTSAPRRGVSPAKTRWVGILSAYPFVYPFAVGMIVALGYAGGAASNPTTLIVIGAIAAVVLLAPAWIVADYDRRELVRRGYEPAPSMAWMLLLPPIGYLIARRRVVGPTY